LKKDRVILDLQARTKDEAVDELIQCLMSAAEVKNPAEFVKSVKAREKLESTGIGGGVGIPHGITDAVRSVVCAMGISKRGIDFDALDGNPVHFIFLLGIPKTEAREYLNLLARICRLFRDEQWRSQITHLTSVNRLMEVITERETTIS
jgi:fructose-specific phosphotransferase system IIA component